MTGVVGWFGSGSVTEHPAWRKVRRWVVVQKYGRDLRPGRVPRFRLELSDRAPHRAREVALSIISRCVGCGGAISPFRYRGMAARGEDVPQHVYLAVTCPLAVRIGCSRSQAARDEYWKIRLAVEHPTIRRKKPRGRK